MKFEFSHIKGFTVIALGFILCLGSFQAPEKSRYKLEQITREQYSKLTFKLKPEDSFDYSQKDEKVLIAKSSKYISREGLVLTIKGSSKGEINLKNSGEDKEQQGDFFYFLGDAASTDFYLVGNLIMSENSNMILVNKDNCDTSRLDDYPFFSPDKKSIFCIKNFEALACSLVIYAKGNDGKYKFQFKKDLPGLQFPETVIWHDNKTVVFKMKEMEQNFTESFKYVYYKISVQ